MMRTLALALALALAAFATPAWASRDTLGLFGDWGAFRDRGTDRKCYAIAMPAQANMNRRSAAYLTVSTWPGRRIGAQVMVMAGAPLRSVSLRIDGQGFDMVVRGESAWMADARGDALLAQALSAGGRASVQLVTQRGTRLTDSYSLRGFADAWATARRNCG
jgi:hypothetical protein